MRREEILAATVAEVQRSGLAATRVADVASALGISPALVFYHFETKDRLLAEAFAYAAERDLVRLDKVVHARGTATQRLRAVLGCTPRAARRRRAGRCGWTPGPPPCATPSCARVSRKLDLRWKEAVAAIIEDGQRSGEFSCPDPHGAAWRITALIDGLAIQVTVHRGVHHPHPDARLGRPSWPRTSWVCRAGTLR